MSSWSRRAASSLVPALAIALLVGCSGDAGSAQQPRPGGDSGSATASTSGAPTPAPEPLTYVAVGASETVGVGADDPTRQAWPRVLRDTELPGSTYVNVGVSGATVRGALAAQVPRALAAEPDLVTVWLAVNDITTLVPVRAYERQLRRLVHRLRRAGEAEVLVANVPDLWRLPAYRACRPGSGVGDGDCLLPSVPAEAEVRATVEDFNQAVRRVARVEGATLVDLSGEDDLTGLTAADGFHPSSAGHREVAAAFARVLRG